MTPQLELEVIPRRHHRFRLTRRVFWDLAIYMVGLGLTVGTVFPYFAMAMGIDDDVALQPSFVAACLGAGFLVGAASFGLCRAVVGGRLKVLSTHLRAVADSIAVASRTGDQAQATAERITVDSDDGLGDTARAFNRLIDTLEAGEHVRSLVRNASDMITVVDPHGTVLYATPSVGWVLGHPPDTLLDSSLPALVHPDDLPLFAAHLQGAVDGVGQAAPSIVTRMCHRNGAWRWMETVATNLLADPAVGGIVLTTRDVSDRKQLEERLREQAFHDPLTGLPNRALFMERLRAAEDRQRSCGAPHAVLFLDLDDLKAVNDGLGHDVGDALLRAVSGRLTQCVPPGGLAARLAGDEFAILLSGPGSAEQATVVAGDVLRALREPVHLTDRYVQAGLSIGMATSQTPEAVQLGLLRAADIAMYIAKSAGKNRAELFQGVHHAHQIDVERLRADLHQALDLGQLEVYYQPIVGLDSQVATGYEALLRWNHPQRGLVSPDQFIPLAEDSGLIVPIGRWVTRQAALQAAAWQRPGQPSLGVSVNASARQIQHPGFVWDVAEALECSGLPPRLLTLEITETVLIQETQRVVDKLGQLKDLGVRLALDDFGTGYSSLSYLRRFPIDVLKIDKSFVDGIVDNSEDRAVADAIIQLGHKLRLEVVAEGIETPEQVRALRSMRCPSGQGYYFGKPSSARGPAFVRPAGLTAVPPGTGVRSGASQVLSSVVASATG